MKDVNLQSDAFEETVKMFQPLFVSNSWAICGGVAVAYWSRQSVVPTVDIDLILDMVYEDEFDVLYKKVTDLRFTLRPIAMKERQFGLRLTHDKMPYAVDLLLTSSSDCFKTYIDQASVQMFPAGQMLPVVRIEDLIAMKQLSNREKDRRDIEVLNASIAKEV